MLIDSHCHLDMLAAKTDLDEVIENAARHEVKYMQTICTKLENFPNILQIAKRYDNVYASVGVHPDEAVEISHKTLIDLAQDPKVIGLGETGLDYYRQDETKSLQISCFTEHIIASQQLALPVIVHTRSAESDTIDIITKEMHHKSFTGLIHCFTGTRHLAEKMLDLGFYISISGIVTFKNTLDLKEIVKFIPLDRLLIETDSPYLAPVPMRGKSNEPAFVSYVAQYIADLKGIPLKKLADQTTDNFFGLFSKAVIGD